jgi:hypothetical protein
MQYIGSGKRVTFKLKVIELSASILQQGKEVAHYSASKRVTINWHNNK